MVREDTACAGRRSVMEPEPVARTVDPVPVSNPDAGPVTPTGPAPHTEKVHVNLVELPGASVDPPGGNGPFFITTNPVPLVAPSEGAIAETSIPPLFVAVKRTLNHVPNQAVD